MFRLSPAELLVFAGVLNNTKESSEDTKVVRQVTKILLHEGFVRKPLSNDIAVLKVGIFLSIKSKYFHSFG
jgi:secreted trypsin-like serine protease